VSVGPENRGHLLQLQGAKIVGFVGDQDGDQALGVGGNVVQVQVALALAGPVLAQRQHPAEPGIGGAVGGQHQQGHAVAQRELASDD